MQHTRDAISQQFSMRLHWQLDTNFARQRYDYRYLANTHAVLFRVLQGCTVSRLFSYNSYFQETVYHLNPLVTGIHDILQYLAVQQCTPYMC